MDDLMSRISGRRLHRSTDVVYPSCDKTMKVLVMDQVPKIADNGDMTIINKPSWFPLDHRLVPDVDISEFTISSIIKNGQIPNVVPTTGALDSVESFAEANRLASMIENDLSVNVSSNNE